MNRKFGNYELSAGICLALTAFSLMGEGGLENIKWFILSDINVFIFLAIAAFFDNKR